MSAPPDGILTGLSRVGGRAVTSSGRPFHARDPRSGEPLSPGFRTARPADVAAAGREAAAAATPFGTLPPSARRDLLLAIAEALTAAADPIVERAMAETALPEARLRGELVRTTSQLRMFADLVLDPAWLDPRVDRGDPERQPLPKPDVRSWRRPLGPVAVFGASNFPLAFSVAGGDTASALAVGCPVVVKAHPSHPGTSELVGRIIESVAAKRGLPAGVFALLFDDGHEVGLGLVQDPRIRAVAFTGSRAGGDALTRAAAARPVPIPVYAEMGSVNPIVVLPGAAQARGAELAAGIHGSFTLGVGQFCTQPGVVFLPVGDDGDAVKGELVRRTNETDAGTLLDHRVGEGFTRGSDGLSAAGARALAVGRSGTGPNDASARVWEIDLESVLERPELLHEVFGPSTLLVRYADESALVPAVAGLEGQLTATLHGEPDELRRHGALVEALADRVGRVLVNGYPTGVEVGPAMVHGGPYPATSDGRSTSVGGRAMERFTRLVAYQDVPQELLPPVLRDAG